MCVHETKECVILRLEIDKLINNGRLAKFLAGGMSTNLTKTNIDLTSPLRLYGTKIFHFFIPANRGQEVVVRIKTSKELSYAKVVVCSSA